MRSSLSDGKARIAAAVAVLALFAPGVAVAEVGVCQHSSAKYLLFGDRMWQPDDLPVPIWVDADGVGEFSAPTLVSAVRRAAEVWNATSCHTPWFEIGGVYDSPTALPDEGPWVAVSASAGQTDSAGRTVLAFTRVGEPDAGPFTTLYIDVNDDLTWTVDGCGGEPDLVGVLVHELGHALGLAHTDVVPSTMRPVLEMADTWSYRNLRADDLDGLSARYADAGLVCASVDDAITPLVCGSCVGDADCGAGGLCVPTDDGAGVCAPPCRDPADCSEGASCQAVAVGDTTCEQRCLPLESTCATPQDSAPPPGRGCAAAPSGARGAWWLLLGVGARFVRRRDYARTGRMAPACRPDTR